MKLSASALKRLAKRPSKPQPESRAVQSCAALPTFQNTNAPMTPTVFILLATSLGVLLLGTYLWRITSNRSIFLHTMFGTVCMMLAAYHAAAHHNVEWAIMLPFF